MANLPAAGAITALATNAEAQQLFEALRDWLSQLPASAEVQLTIASGTITPATRDQGSIAVETEAAAASDDLANIAQTNVQAGALLLLRAADASHTVVVKHAAGGAGQILLQYDTDFSLDDTDKWLLLKRVDANWEEVLRSYGNDPVAQRRDLGFKAGADIASGATTDLGAATGNTVTVTHSTGTTAITSLGGASLPAGTEIETIFSISGGTLTITHHATNLYLAGGANITLANGDVIRWRKMHDSNAEWKMVGGVKADGTAWVGGEGAWTDYSATSTVVGWSSFAVKHLYYKDIGKTRFVYFKFDGTSNSTTASFTLPSASSNTIDYGGPVRTDDNGVTGLGHYVLPANSATVAAYYGVTASAWSSSGTKRLMGQFTYQLP